MQLLSTEQFLPKMKRDLPARPAALPPCSDEMTGVNDSVLFRLTVARSSGFEAMTYTGSSPATGLSGNEVTKVRAGIGDAVTGAVEKTGTGCFGNVTIGSGSLTVGRCCRTCGC